MVQFIEFQNAGGGAGGGAGGRGGGYILLNVVLNTG